MSLISSYFILLSHLSSPPPLTLFLSTFFLSLFHLFLCHTHTSCSTDHRPFIPPAFNHKPRRWCDVSRFSRIAVHSLSRASSGLSESLFDASSNITSAVTASEDGSQLHLPSKVIKPQTVPSKKASKNHFFTPKQTLKLHCSP